jgi:hypothetical protein
MAGFINLQDFYKIGGKQVIFKTQFCLINIDSSKPFLIPSTNLSKHNMAE